MHTHDTAPTVRKFWPSCIFGGNHTERVVHTNPPNCPWLHPCNITSNLTSFSFETMQTALEAGPWRLATNYTRNWTKAWSETIILSQNTPRISTRIDLVWGPLHNIKVLVYLFISFKTISKFLVSRQIGLVEKVASTTATRKYEAGKLRSSAEWKLEIWQKSYQTLTKEGRPRMKRKWQNMSDKGLISA